MTNRSGLNKGLSILAAVAGVTALFIGGAALKWYIWDIVIQQAGESDRSMLFWGIPIVFIGMGAIATGTALLWLARRKLSPASRQRLPSAEPGEPDGDSGTTRSR